MTINGRDVACGAIFIAIGAYFCIVALRTLPLGTAFNMGPGYFPIVLGGLLVLLGGLIALGGVGGERGPLNRMPWRAVILITLAPILFGATVRGLGLIPATAIASALAAFASARITAPWALAVSLGLTAFCTLVFGVALRLPVALIGPWLAG